MSQLSEIPPQGAVPWGAPPVGPEEAAAETVVPSAVQGPEAGAVAEEPTAPGGGGRRARGIRPGSSGRGGGGGPRLGSAQAPQAPQAAHMPEGSEGHLVEHAVEVAPSPGPGRALKPSRASRWRPALRPSRASRCGAAPGADARDGRLPGPRGPGGPRRFDTLPVAQDLPHLAPTADDTAGHLADTPAQVSEAGEPVATEQVLQPAQDPQSTPAAEPARPPNGPQLADQATHLAEPVAQAVDQASQFPARDARFPEASPHPGTRGPVGGHRRGARVPGGGPAAGVRPTPRGVRRPRRRRGPAQVARAAHDSYGQAPRRRGLPGPGRAVRARRRGPRRVHRGRCRRTGRRRRPRADAARGHEPVARRAPPRRHGRRTRSPGRPPGLRGGPPRPVRAHQGTVPTPHLAPTPPHAMTVPPLPTEERPSVEEPPVEEPGDGGSGGGGEPGGSPRPSRRGGARHRAGARRPGSRAPRGRGRDAPYPEPFEADPEPVVHDRTASGRPGHPGRRPGREHGRSGRRTRVPPAPRPPATTTPSARPCCA